MPGGLAELGPVLLLLHAGRQPTDCAHDELPQLQGWGRERGKCMWIIHAYSYKAYLQHQEKLINKQRLGAPLLCCEYGG